MPIDTIKLTPVPERNRRAAAGSWLMIFPAARVVLGAVVTVPMFKPRPLIALCAAAWVCPTTLGTVAVSGPEEMTRLTAAPAGTLVPADMPWLITCPAGTVYLP